MCCATAMFRASIFSEPYTVREARFHVKRIKEILTSCDLADAFNGQNFASLSYVNAVWSGDGNGASSSGATNGSAAGAAGDKRRAKPESMDCTPPDYIMPKSKERPLLPLHPNFTELKVIFFLAICLVLFLFFSKNATMTLCVS